jgi:hypothetical protein
MKIGYRGSSWFHINTNKAWTYSLRLPNMASTALGFPLPDELETRVNLPSRQYYRDIIGIGDRNGCTGLDWLDKFLNAKSEIQLYRRDSPQSMAAELMYIANNKPEIILDVL